MASSLLLKALIVGVCLGVVAARASSGKDKSEVKKQIKSQKCSSPCPDELKPICASDGSGKPLSFGSQCVLDKYNCEHNTQLKKQSDGECPNGGGIRLA